MNDALNRSVTSHPPWAHAAMSLLTNHTRNVSSLDVTTPALAAVTQCLYNVSVNETLCEAADTSGNGSLAVDSDLSPHPMWLTVFLGVLAAIVSIVTVLGNVTVLLAFGLERSIRQPTNYFIASLAVSDLLIGTFSMPLFTQYLLLTFWPLGPWLCDLWLSLDWTVCLTSQYTVFFITMDRFLSVKIPAKYRNWRTERKVLVMVSITWVLPAVVFFTTIIGWQYFVGGRQVLPEQCEVQFMKDPLFTFLLTIGYYWITLVVMCVLYGGIYKVALELQRKSDAKQRKLQSTMELAAERFSSGRLGGGAISSNDNDPRQKAINYFKKQREKKKSIKARDGDAGGGTGLLPNDQNNVTAGSAAAAIAATAANTTSFSGRNMLAAGDIPRHDSLGGGSVLTEAGDNKDDDRSSSPAFASDDEGSSSGPTPGSKSPKVSSTPAFSNHRRSTKSSLNPKAGIAGIVNTAMLTTPESFRATLVDGAHAHAPQLPLPGCVLPPEQPPGDGDGFSRRPTLPEESAAGGTPMLPSGQSLKPGHGGPSYSRLQSQPDSAAETETGGDQHLVSQSDGSDSAPATRRMEHDVKGCPYIDEKSFLALASREDMTSRHLSADQLATSEKVAAGCDADSPLWKRRNSLPLPPIATDVFDIALDDELDIEVNEVTMTTALTCKQNGGEEVSFCPSTAVPGTDTGDEAPPMDGECSALPLTRAAGQGEEADSPSLSSEARRARAKAGGDGKLHSFVKSVRSRNSRRRNRRERKSKSENRARKALRTITIILGAFVLCWTPYHIMLFVIALCKGYGCINLDFYNFTYWLCYLNSPINPFCYAFANAQFKRTFLRILRFDWHRT